MDKQQYRLTPEHREQLKPWADRWIANAMSTQKMTAEDREVCRAAVTGLYKAAKLEPPRNTVFVSSPFVLAFAGGFSAATWWASKNQPQAAEVVVSNVAQHTTLLRLQGHRDALLSSISNGVAKTVREATGYRDLSTANWMTGFHSHRAAREAAVSAVTHSTQEVGLRTPLPPTDDETWMEVSRALSAVLQFALTLANTHLNIPGVIGDGDAEKATEGARVPQPVSFDIEVALADLICITQLLNAYRLRANVDNLMNELHVGTHEAALGEGVDANETVRLSDDTASYPKVYDRADTDSGVEIAARLERVTSEVVAQLHSMMYVTCEAAYGSLKDAQEAMENAHRGRPRLDVEEALYAYDHESLRRSLRELTGVLERVMEPISRARLDVVEAALRDANPNLAVAPGESVTGGTSFRRSGYEGASSLAADDGTVRGDVGRETWEAVVAAISQVRLLLAISAGPGDAARAALEGDREAAWVAANSDSANATHALSRPHPLSVSSPSELDGMTWGEVHVHTRLLINRLMQSVNEFVHHAPVYEAPEDVRVRGSKTDAESAVPRHEGYSPNTGVYAEEHQQNDRVSRTSLNIAHGALWERVLNRIDLLTQVLNEGPDEAASLSSLPGDAAEAVSNDSKSKTQREIALIESANRLLFANTTALLVSLALTDVRNTVNTTGEFQEAVRAAAKDAAAATDQAVRNLTQEQAKRDAQVRQIFVTIGTSTAVSMALDTVRAPSTEFEFATQQGVRSAANAAEDATSKETSNSLGRRGSVADHVDDRSRGDVWDHVFQPNADALRSFSDLLNAHVDSDVFSHLTQDRGPHGTVRAQVIEATRQAIVGAVERPADGRRPRVDEIAPKRPNASAAIAVTGVMHESQSPRHRTWPWDRLDALLITLVTSTTLTTAASQMTRSRSNSSAPDAVREMQEGQHEATQQEWAKEASGAVPAAPNNSVNESIVRLRHSLWNLSNVVEHLTLLDVSRALDHVFNADTDSDSAETFAEVTAGEMEVRGATGQLGRMWHPAVDRSNMDAVRFAVNAHTLILLDELLNTSPFAAESAAATPGSMAGAQAALDDLSRGSKHVAAATPHTLPDDTFETTSGPFLKKVHAGVSTADVSEVAMSMWDQAITALEEMITSVKHSIESQKREPDLSNWYVVGDDMAKLARELGVGDFGLRCATLTWKMWQGGNQWSGGDSFFSFFRHVAKLDIDYTDWDHWEKLLLHSGPRVLHPQFCMISDRPEVLLVDDRNRPHCDTGPFCRWRDGSALYAVHGVRVPAWIIEKPERLTAKHIDDERNAEVRRVMIERFTPERWLRESGAKVVAEAPADHPHVGLRTARLLRKEVADDEPILMLDLLNSTPEPDGTVKRYFLRVDPNAYGGKAAKNLQAAAASTWRLSDGSLAFERYTDYAPELES